MSTRVSVSTKSILRRDLRSIEPKLVALAIAAGSSSQVVTLLAAMLAGTKVVPLIEAATLLPLLVGLLVGYLKVSTHKGALLPALEADLPGQAIEVAQAAADAGLVPQAAAQGVQEAVAIGTAAGVFPALDYSNVPAPASADPAPQA